MHTSMTKIWYVHKWNLSPTSTCMYIVYVDECNMFVSERERRHFPDIHNNCSAPAYRSRGRRYIPHGYGFNDEWTPHNQNINIKYTE